MRRKGFTLLEVMVGLAILAIFVTLVQGVYTGAAKNKRASEEATGAAHGSSAILGKMADELSMAFQSSSRKGQTILLAATDMENNSKVEFTTMTPRIENLSTGGETRLRYEVRPDPETEGAVKLVRIEMADPFGDMDRDGVELTMLGGIKRFTFSCYNGSEWVSMWDGGYDLENPVLPLAAKLTIEWADKFKNKKIISTATPIWAAAGINAKVKPEEGQ